MTANKNLQKVFSAVQSSATSVTWSAGVELTRSARIIERSENENEIVLRVLPRGSAVSVTVNIYPEDEFWSCDCGEREDPCRHVAASVIALKSGKTEKDSGNDEHPSAPRIRYNLTRQDSALRISREVRHTGGTFAVSTSLTHLMGGINSGRVKLPHFIADQRDYLVDQVIGTALDQIPDAARLKRIFEALGGSDNVYLNGSRVKVESRALRASLVITDESEGFRLRMSAGADTDETFRNGAARFGDTLYAIDFPSLTREEGALLWGSGRLFQASDVIQLVSELLPALERKMEVLNLSRKLPKSVKSSPRLSFQLERPAPGSLWALARLVYGSPAIAELTRKGLEVFDRQKIPERDITAEANLVRELRWKLNMQPGQPIDLKGDEAVRFIRKVESWEKSGAPMEEFTIRGELEPRLEFRDGRLNLGFVPGGGGAPLAVDNEAVFQAWRDRSTHVPLLSGGWATIPDAWLALYGEKLSALLAAQKESEALPVLLRPEAHALFEDSGQTPPPELAGFVDALTNRRPAPDIDLDPALAARLRDYQITGVRWLQFLRQHGLGALLADDMGLGKTLQALCAVRGRTLIVCPTSVLSGWQEQIRRFRPELDSLIYHGGNRRYDENCQIIITSYTIMRMEIERFSAPVWGTIILDEAQTIKNPGSQVARAAYDLKADFRIALSGTPVENRLDDLWSQFHFLNPGLLGSHTAFLDRYARQISRGDEASGAELKRRVRPFILRRLKQEVAKELPERTDVVLHCELDERETDLYRTLLLSMRGDVIKKLQEGGSMFSILEILLRLRQACCHPALVPNQEAVTSSKTELLLQTLENSTAMGHRSLVFSQWTSFLDLLEPHLASAGITFSRLDGSTADRSGVVAEFQKPDGPQVMLLSLKAGGVGLTLTAADHIFLLDPWWNPAVESQAADRAHRIGQTNPVLVHRLVARDTIEDKVLQLQISKRALANAVLDDGDAPLTLSRDDLLALLE